MFVNTAGSIQPFFLFCEVAPCSPYIQAAVKHPTECTRFQLLCVMRDRGLNLKTIHSTGRL